MAKTLKLGLILLLSSIILLSSQCAYLSYGYLNSFDSEVNDFVTNSVRRNSLLSLLTEAKNADAETYYIEGKSTNSVHNGIISTDDGRHYFIVFLEHHSNAAEINKVAVIDNKLVVVESNGHICGGLSTLYSSKSNIDELLNVLSR